VLILNCFVPREAKICESAMGLAPGFRFIQPELRLLKYGASHPCACS